MLVNMNKSYNIYYVHIISMSDLENNNDKNNNDNLQLVTQDKALMLQEGGGGEGIFYIVFFFPPLVFFMVGALILISPFMFIAQAGEAVIGKVKEFFGKNQSGGYLDLLDDFDYQTGGAAPDVFKIFEDKLIKPLLNHVFKDQKKRDKYLGENGLIGKIKKLFQTNDGKVIKNPLTVKKKLNNKKKELSDKIKQNGGNPDGIVPENFKKNFLAKMEKIMIEQKEKLSPENKKRFEIALGAAKKLWAGAKMVGNFGKGLMNKAKGKLTEIKNTPDSGNKRGDGKGVGLGENITGRAKELGGKLLRGDVKGATDQLKGRAMELKNKFMGKSSKPAGDDDHMHEEAPVGPLLAETAGSAAKAGMTLFKESIGAFISVMSNIAGSARNRMTRRINQYGLNKTRKANSGSSGSSGNRGSLAFNMDFDLDDPSQRSKVANLAGKMGNNIQKKLDTGKIQPQAGMITAPQGEGETEAPQGEGEEAAPGEGEEAAPGEGEEAVAGEEIPIEEDHSDDWFKVIRKYYIVNGEIVESRGLSQLKKRRSDDWDRFKSDPKANNHLITFTTNPKKPKNYLVKIKQCVLNDCVSDKGKIVIPKKATLGVGGIKGEIELYKAYGKDNKVVQKFIDILDAEKLSDCLKSTPDKKITFYSNQKKKKKGEKEEFSIKDINKNYKYKFIPCVPIKSYSKIRDSFKTTDFHSTDNESCTKGDFDKFLEAWKKNGETMNSKFIEMMGEKSSAPLMVRMVCLKSSDEKEWKKQEKEGVKAENAKSKSESRTKTRTMGDKFKGVFGKDSEASKIQKKIETAEKAKAKAEKAKAKAEENMNTGEMERIQTEDIDRLQKELDELHDSQNKIIADKSKKIQEKSDVKKEKLAEKDAKKVTGKSRSGVMGRAWTGGDFPLHNAVLKKKTEKNELEKILDVKDQKTGKQKYDINIVKKAGMTLTPRYGGTVLHAALTDKGLKNPEQLANIKFLVEKGVDINIKDNRKKGGKTPLDIAKEKDQYDIVKFLESKSGGKRRKYTRRRRKKTNRKTKKKKYTRSKSSKRKRRRRRRRK